MTRKATSRLAEFGRMSTYTNQICISPAVESLSARCADDIWQKRCSVVPSTILSRRVQALTSLVDLFYTRTRTGMQLGGRTRRVIEDPWLCSPNFNYLPGQQPGNSRTPQLKAGVGLPPHHAAFSTGCLRSLHSPSNMEPEKEPSKKDDCSPKRGAVSGSMPSWLSAFAGPLNLFGFL